VEQRVAEGGYGSVSEYMRELVRLDKRRKARERLSDALKEGLESGPPIPVYETFWKDLYRELDERTVRGETNIVLPSAASGQPSD
jgi:antitoxin ParD1/3/4